MSFNSLLNTTCDIYARGYTEDKNGQRIPNDGTPVATGVKCRFQSKSSSFNANARFQTISNNDRIYLKQPGFSLVQGVHYFLVNGKKYDLQDPTDLGGARRGLLELSLSLTE